MAGIGSALHLQESNMNHMKKILAIVLIAMCSFQSVTAQRTGETSISIGPELLFTSGKFADFWGLGIGGSAQAERFFKDNVSGLAYFGFNTFSGKTVRGIVNVKYKSQNIIPIRLGARYYIGEGFHVGPQLGVGFLSTGGSSETAFAYSLQAGYNFNTKKGKSVDAAFKYDGYSKSGGAFS
ncbi:MAG TPA: hypothetical protein DHV17_06255, partial [Chitinophagaceae bacterium]|nr:hypothetical protein [Chitinophagaceae bacterium]